MGKHPGNSKLKRLAIKATLLLMVVLTAREYARWAYFNSLDYAQMTVHGMTERPYVYRALVPWLAQLLALVGVRADYAVTIVIILSAIGLVYGIKYLLSASRS